MISSLRIYQIDIFINKPVHCDMKLRYLGNTSIQYESQLSVGPDAKEEILFSHSSTFIGVGELNPLETDACRGMSIQSFVHDISTTTINKIL